jgi:hypothetical protein
MGGEVRRVNEKTSSEVDVRHFFLEYQITLKESQMQSIPVVFVGMQELLDRVFNIPGEIERT